MSHPTYDVIVLGVGGMGAATLFELARRGRRVLGLEQFPLGHVLGSSHGHSRIIRQAYYEHPDYVPLLRRAYEGWYDLEQRVGRRLLTECPCLSIGLPDSPLVVGVRESAAQHGLAIENLDAAGVRARFPAFHVRDDTVGVVERSAGILAVDDGVAAHVAVAPLARSRGAPGDGRWLADVGGGMQVRTDRGTYAAARLVVTAGPWASRFLGDLGVPLTVMRQVPLWFGPREPAAFRRDVFPVFIADMPYGFFYGMPMLDEAGVKVAQHYGAPELPGPDAVERSVQPGDELPVRRFLSDVLPDGNGPCRRASVCVYTLTPDRHFILDRHPGQEGVVIAAGFSGHGYKFAPVVGEIMADLAEQGRTRWPIGFFRIGRFGA